MSSTFGQVVQQAVPIITLEVLIPWAWECLFYSNTTLDFAAWLLSVAFLDSAFPGSIPCFRSTKVWVRLWDILRLVFLWISFRVSLYMIHQMLMYLVKDYSKVLCSVGLCWLRLVAPLVAILCFTAYLYFATEKKRKMALAAELEKKWEMERALEAAELAVLPTARGSSRRRNSSRQASTRQASTRQASTRQYPTSRVSLHCCHMAKQNDPFAVL